MIPEASYNKHLFCYDSWTRWIMIYVQIDTIISLRSVYHTGSKHVFLPVGKCACWIHKLPKQQSVMSLKTKRICLRSWSRSSTNQKVGGLIPSSSILHIKVPVWEWKCVSEKLEAIYRSAVWMCVWMRECDFWCRALWKNKETSISGVGCLGLY